MGDPRRRRKKYAKPSHPWQRERIDEEKALSADYGTKNKRELWKSASLLRTFKRQAKKLITLTTKQADVESAQLLQKLVLLGLLEKNAKIEDVLSIDSKDILERRLQTLVLRKKLARSIGQARQFIVHRHISIGDKVINIPSYLVSVEEEGKICFRPTSPLSKDDHPERFVEDKKEEGQPKKERKPKKGRKEAWGKAPKRTAEVKEEKKKGADKPKAEEKKGEAENKK